MQKTTFTGGFFLFLLIISIGFWIFVTTTKAEGGNCGIEASSSLLHQNPWLVLLEYWRKDVKTRLRCGATLIDPWHIITAAHCVQSVRFTKIVARLGDYDLSKENDCVGSECANGVKEIKIAEIVVHPNFDGLQNDIAVLKLEEAVEFTDFIRPICLPTKQFPDGSTFYASGWGEEIATNQYSDIKKIIPLPHWKTSDCKKAYKNTNVPENVICAGGEEGIDTCRGDSGGPLALVRDKTELWGVTSIGNIHCGTKGSPGIYTNVALYLNWIKDVTSKVNN